MNRSKSEQDLSGSMPAAAAEGPLLLQQCRRRQSRARSPNERRGVVGGRVGGGRRRPRRRRLLPPPEAPHSARSTACPKTPSGSSETQCSVPCICTNDSPNCVISVIRIRTELNRYEQICQKCHIVFSPTIKHRRQSKPYFNKLGANL